MIDDKDLDLLSKKREKAFGEVFRGTWLGTKVAIKRIKVKIMKMNRSLKLRKANAHQYIGHPNIILFMPYALICLFYSCVTCMSVYAYSVHVLCPYMLILFMCYVLICLFCSCVMPLYAYSVYVLYPHIPILFMCYALICLFGLCVMSLYAYSVYVLCPYMHCVLICSMPFYTYAKVRKRAKIR